MNLQKGTISFNGKEYPTIVIELTREEGEKHFESTDKTFADETLFDDICKDGEPDWNNNDDPRVDVDTSIDWYTENNLCEKFCNGEISESEMKVKVARIILSW